MRELRSVPNVFGKWCKPYYNSPVATFCQNTARGLPIQVNDPAAPVTLVFVDDVIERVVQLMDDSLHGRQWQLPGCHCGRDPQFIVHLYVLGL